MLRRQRGSAPTEDAGSRAAAENLVDAPPERGSDSGIDTILRLVGLVVFFLGLGVLARAYSAQPYSGQAYAFFWGGLAACFAGCVALGAGRRANALHRLVALVLLGGALYAPTYLRNPAYPMFQDELLHLPTLELMRELGTSAVPRTYFPIPGDYPGLQFLGLSAIYAAGLSTEWVVRLLPLVIHLMAPVLAYRALRVIGVPAALAFFGSLIYLANTGYFFFHSTFSYETPGILLFLLVAVLSLRTGDGDGSGDDRAGIALRLLAVAAVVVTHPPSGLMTIALLSVLALASSVQRRAEARSQWGTALFAAVLWFGWFAYHADSSYSYLGGNLTARLGIIPGLVAALLSGRGSDLRPLFYNSSAPVAERALAYLFPVLVVLLTGLGVWALQRRRPAWAGRRLAAFAALGVFGPLLWLATTPLVLSNSSDVAFRAWPFLFVGVALFGCLGAGVWLRGESGRAGMAAAAAYGIAALLLAASVVLNEHPAGRFRTAQPVSAAGPESLTPDLIHAAEWTESNYGRYNTIAADLTSSFAFSAFGKQKADVWANWTPFYAQPERAGSYVDEYEVDYVVADQRDARLLPRYRYYFNVAELYGAGPDPRPSEQLGEQLPADSLRKFDRMPELERIYDNGDIVLYENDHP